ncbi:hypothetical protein GCM10022207_87190 [Streptomyces lannensis]|uniref:Uncharacterized protein n=1 Tax=Streptomyces lannensis TaxID=766498 RepID=A0ABP7LR91_9ACTN
MIDCHRRDPVRDVDRQGGKVFVAHEVAPYRGKGWPVTGPPAGDSVANLSIATDTEYQIRNPYPKKQTSVSEYTRPHERSASRYP